MRRSCFNYMPALRCVVSLLCANAPQRKRGKKPMISVLKQTRTGRNVSYVLERDGQTYAAAQIDFSLLKPQIQLVCRQNDPIKIVPNFGGSFQKSMETGARRIVPCDIIDAAGMQIGTIEKIRVGNLFSAYFYTQLTLYGRVLRIYEVGLGKEGICCPIYDGETQLSQVEKSPVVRDNLDEYTLCCLDDFGETAALLFALFLDFFSYRNAGQHVRGTKNVQYVYTRRKELLAKYDPSFRMRCEGKSGEITSL